jgi:hypothetical protein
MRTIKVIFPVGVLLAGIAVSTSSMYATPDFAKKEKKSCTTCHATSGGKKEEMAKNLNAVGTCYKDDHSLAKCAPQKK